MISTSTPNKSGELVTVSQRTGMANVEQTSINNRFPASLPKPWLAQWNESLEQQSPIARIEWTMENLPSHFVLSSSFGIQSAVMLHMMTQIDANIPVLITYFRSAEFPSFIASETKYNPAVVNR